MKYVTYECLNCGKSFYFYGATAEAIIGYWKASGILRELTGLCITGMNLMLQRQVKCCEYPIISVSIDGPFE